MNAQKTVSALFILAAGLAFLAASPRENKPEAPAPDLRIVLGVNMTPEAVIYPGSPLIAQAEIASAKAEKPELGQLKLEVKNEEGKNENWAWEPAVKPGLWLISPEAAKALKPGRYRLTASLDGVQSAPAAVEVRQDAAPEAAQKQAQFFSALYDAMKGDEAKALATVDELAKTAANPSIAYELKGDLLAKIGKPIEASEAYGKALETFKGDLPPARLARKNAEMWKKASDEFRKQNPDYKPPVWTGKPKTSKDASTPKP